MSRAGAYQRWRSSFAAPIREFLCWTFAITAFIAIRLTVDVTPKVLHEAYTAHGIRWKMTGIVLGLLMPVQCIIFAMAWWTVWRRKAFARAWAIAASLILILLSCGMLYSSAGSIWWKSILWRVALPVLAIGVAGLVVFSPRNLTSLLTDETRQQPSVPGDGTHAILDKAVWILPVAGYIVGARWWNQWADAQNLTGRIAFPYPLLEVIFAGLIVTLVHELGHAIVGNLLGMKLRAFTVGPFAWRNREGKWGFQFLPAKILALGGVTGVVPTTLEHFRSSQLCMTAAGPFANLISGLLAFCAVTSAPDTPWEPAWHFLSLIATFSLLACIVNLIPIRTATSYSDGAQIYQLLSKGPWGDYHRTISIVTSSLVTQLRPRDFDIESIHRASAYIVQGQRAMLLRLYASDHYIDSGQIPEAAQSLADAEKIYLESAQDIPAELHTIFVFGAAFLRRDAAAARLWWQRMEEKKPTNLNVDYWLSRSALCWIKDHISEAEEAWQKAFSLGQQLPKTGAYEFDRHRVSLLRQAMDEPASIEQPLDSLAES